MEKLNYNRVALKKVSKLMSFTVLILVMLSCDYTRNTAGWQYFDDMAKSPAYETYTPNPNFPDGKTMQPPVPGTIPREMIPYPYEKTEEDRLMAANNLINPLELNDQAIERGKIGRASCWERVFI